MAKNWTVAEVATTINENGTMNENVLDFGRRFPVTTNLVVAAMAGDKNAVIQMLTALPEYVTMSKLEKAFKTAIEEGTPIGPVASDEDTDAEDENEDVADEAPAEKPAKKANKPAAKETASDADDDLESKTGKELLEIGKELGIPVKAMKGKAMAIESIRKARAEQGGAMNAPESDDSEDEGTDYSKMTAKELYKLCKERGIDAEQKKPAKYYIEMLEEADSEDDTEEENTVDYSKMTAKELYGLCKERKIKAEQKKPAKYYIELLEAADEGDDEEAEDEWSEDDSAEDEKPVKPAKGGKPAKKSEEEEWDI